jgi:hypothetical protein
VTQRQPKLVGDRGYALMVRTHSEADNLHIVASPRTGSRAVTVVPSSLCTVGVQSRMKSGLAVFIRVATLKEGFWQNARVFHPLPVVEEAPRIRGWDRLAPAK